MKILGYRVSNGCREDCMNTSRSFLIFANDVASAEAFIDNYIKESIEGEKHENAFGDIENWWWRHYLVERVKVSQFNHKSANIVYLLEGEID